MKTTKYRVAIADDHGMVRDGLKMLIHQFQNFEVTLEATDGKDLMNNLESLSKVNLPHICILDISMPEMNGYQTAEALTANFPEINILALSMFDNEFGIIRMLRLGAKGYLNKGANAKELLKALTVIAQGGYYHPDVPHKRLQRKISSHRELSLTEKELMFLKLCCREMTYEEMASIMHVGVRTIPNYRDSLFKKLNVKTRVGLTIYAMKAGLGE